MARRYTRARAEEAVGLLRAARPGAFIAADLISGFPGETEEDHAHTESLVRKLELASLHVFPFSRRPGTPAWNMKNRVPERVSRERASALRELSAEGWARYAKRLAGGRLELIIEKETSGGEWEGLSENYMTARVRGDFSPGSLVSVKVTALGKGFVNAEVCPEN
jgi:threonylcarbamoyladenosine tRNA methylthiotransferase MtaB